VAWIVKVPVIAVLKKKISFLNRYFVYKKVREVNIDKLQLELGEYQDAVVEREKKETKHAVVIAKEEDVKIKPKVRKQSKKILLVAATEAVDEPAKKIEEEIEKKKSKKETKKETKKPKKLLIIESDEEEE
jgi:hypothetical protein